jgi:hypothetical protein
LFVINIETHFDKILENYRADEAPKFKCFPSLIRPGRLRETALAAPHAADSGDPGHAFPVTPITDRTLGSEEKFVSRAPQ